jgi:hypothetical protein
MIIAYIIYIIHIISCGNTISQTLPAKTSQTSLICWLQVLRGLWELHLRTVLTYASHNGDIMVANIYCKSHDNYSERNWHPPAACMEQVTRQVRSRSREWGRVRLAWTASISLYCAIRSTQNRGLQQKISTPATIMLRFTCVKHLRIDLALISLKGFAA